MPPPPAGPQNPEPPTPRTAEAAVRSSQMVVLMLAIGLLLGGGVMGFIGLSRGGGGGGGGLGPANTPVPASPAFPPPPPPATTGVDVFPIMVPVVSLTSLAIALWIPSVLVRSASKQWEARADDEAAMRRVYGGFATMSVMQGALIEAPGLLGAAGTMNTGNGLLLLAPLVSVVMLGVLFPRTSRMDRWIDEVTGQLPGTAASTTRNTDDEAA